MYLPQHYNEAERFVNVFYLDDDPVKAAQAHCDKHVVKMILETAQILSTVWALASRTNEEAEWAHLYKCEWKFPDKLTPPDELDWLHTTLAGNRIYKSTHTNHPSVVWAGMYGGNYSWLYQLGQALLEEYTFRYDRTHAATKILQALEIVPPSLKESMGIWCEATPAMPPQFVKSGDSVASYRNYYKEAKYWMLKYTRRQPPNWLAKLAISQS